MSVLIPTYNEAQAIDRVLEDLPSNLTTEVIVVDSNSSDGTPEIAARMGARFGGPIAVVAIKEHNHVREFAAARSVRHAPRQGS